MAELENKDVWGDDELIAPDVSIPYLLQGADWTGLFNQKGFDGQYPMVLFMHDEAERLNDALMEEINRTQVLTGDKQLRVDVSTKFIDIDGQPTGRALLCISGLSEFDARYTDDLMYLLRSGVGGWLTECYSTHGITPRVEWLDDMETHAVDGQWHEWLGERLPLGNTSNQHAMLASIDKV